MLEADRSSVWKSREKPSDRTRLSEISYPDSGDWLTFYYAVCARAVRRRQWQLAFDLELDLCNPQQCSCGDLVGSYGHRGHQDRSRNELISRSLTREGFLNVTVLPGISRKDGNRPDGLTHPMAPTTVSCLGCNSNRHVRVSGRSGRMGSNPEYKYSQLSITYFLFRWFLRP